LKLARNLLARSGVILISIDEHEFANLRKLTDEIFGEENFVAELVWEKTRKNDAKLFSVGHEYIIVYARELQHLKEIKTVWREPKPGAAEIIGQWHQLKALHGRNFDEMEKDLREWYKSLPNTHPSKKLSRYKHVDERGPWRDRDISWPGGGGPRYDVSHPVTGEPCKVPERGWTFGTIEAMRRQIDLGLVVFREDHTKPPFCKAHLLPVLEEELALEAQDVDSDDDGGAAGLQVMPSVIYKQSQVATKYLREIMGKKIFDNPKDHEVLARIIRYVSPNDGLVLDFFAGSCSTAESVLRLNQEDGGKRRFVVIQLPEQLDPTKDEQLPGYDFCSSIGAPANVAEIGKERVRRVARLIAASNGESIPPGPEPAQEALWRDTGFKVFKLDASNFQLWDADSGNLERALLDAVEIIKSARTELDILYELLLKYGLDLAVPIEEREIVGTTVYVVGAGALIVCLADGVTLEVAEGIAALKSELRPEITRVVFKDAGFANDVVKT
ncbi:MAG: site-specific DNA-methyltransferase, partial [Terrimicrobiaceae bacterium]